MDPEGGVVVIGGGWAGLSCAAALAGQGIQVTLLEKRNRLGGRACSFPDSSTGDEVDNGQHLLMSCFSESLRFLERIGTADGIHFQDNLEVAMIDPSGRRSAFHCAPLPAPLHLLGGVLGHGALRLSDRLRLIRSWRNIRRRLATPERSSAREPGGSGTDTTVEEWLDHLGQTPGTRRAFWHPMAIATLNEDPRQASSALFEVVLRQVLQGGRPGSRLGLSQVPLSRLVDPAVRRYVEERGGRVILNAGVSRIGLERDGVRSVRLRDGSEIAASVVVSAVPPTVLPRILPEEIPPEDPFFGRARDVGSSPILSVHLWYDRSILDLAFAGLLDSPVHWIFGARRGHRSDEDAGQRVALVSSGARELMDRPAEDLARLADAEVRRYLPAAREAVLEHSVVLKERSATFAPGPAAQELRPAQATPIPNLFLAGDWTDTGLPGTLESAVLSGHRCAGLIADRLGRAA